MKNGIVQVNDARHKIDSSIKAVDHVSDLMSDIAKSSEEQTVAINRVASLIGQIDQATQLNVPMAEDALQAANELKGHVSELLRTVNVFRLI